MSDEHNHPANRRIDRIRDPSYLQDLPELSLEELRSRRDECLAEREYVSLLRRLVQGRAEILQAELGARSDAEDTTPLIERLNDILGSEERQGPARGEAVRIGVPEDELLLARRRIERLVADAEISDPSTLDDERLADAVERLTAEERVVSDARADVIAVLDTVQAELKRRYKQDPTLALH